MAGYSASKHAVQVVLYNYLQYLRNYRLFITQGYFDSLRMEEKSDNIDVQMVCPGPIVTNISANAFSSQLDKVCVLILVAIYSMHIKTRVNLTHTLRKMKLCVK